MEKVSAVKRIEEGTRRLKYLGVAPEIIAAFKDGKLFYSDFIELSSWGNFEHVNEKTEWLMKINELEGLYDCTVFFILHYKTADGEMLDCLYVSNDESVWDEDQEELEKGYALVYTMALNTADVEQLSEFTSGKYVLYKGGLYSPRVLIGYMQ